MFLNTQNWDQLKRAGAPDLVVWRTPLVVNGRTLHAGDRFPIEGTERCIRNLYDQNKITTVENYSGVVSEPEPKKSKKVKQ